MLVILKACRSVTTALQHVCRFGAASDFGIVRPMFNSEGGLSVDLALRLNVLAIGAVFVFIGAILFGAF